MYLCCVVQLHVSYTDQCVPIVSRYLTSVYARCMDSVDWNGGMEWWNGLDWNGMEWPDKRCNCGCIRPLTLKLGRTLLKVGCYCDTPLPTGWSGVLV